MRKTPKAIETSSANSVAKLPQTSCLQKYRYFQEKYGMCCLSESSGNSNLPQTSCLQKYRYIQKKYNHLWHELSPRIQRELQALGFRDAPGGGPTKAQQWNDRHKTKTMPTMWRFKWEDLTEDQVGGEGDFKRSDLRAHSHLNRHIVVGIEDCR